MTLLEELTGPFDNLTPFTHPNTNRAYLHMSPSEIKEVIGILAQSSKDTTLACVLGVESGAHPIVTEVCNITGQVPTFLKVPREVTPDLSLYVKFLLSEEEATLDPGDSWRELVATQAFYLGLQPEYLPNRTSALEAFKYLLKAKPGSTLRENLNSYEVRDQDYVPLFNAILKGTAFSEFLNEKFVLMEEFITSGTVLSVINHTLCLFNPDYHYKLVCYNLNLLQRDAPDWVAYSYMWGSPWSQDVAYPFENRLDLLGFLYTQSDGKVIHTELEDLAHSASSGNLTLVEEFLQGLLDHLGYLGVLDTVNQKLPRKDLASYNDQSHLLRWTLRQLETRPVPRDYLDQLFEMYAPSWSPLPVDFHLGFTETYSKFHLSEVVEAFAPLWVEVADTVISQTASALCSRGEEYWRDPVWVS